MIPQWYTRPLHGGESGRDVEVVQSKLGILTGVYDDDTKTLVRGYQRRLGLTVDGVVGPLTASALGQAADHALLPPWFSRDLRTGFSGEDVAGLRSSLGLSVGNVFDEETRRAVLRYQSAHDMPLTGVADRTFCLSLP